MLAIDTNIVIRYLTGDHSSQAAKAKSLVDGSDTYLCTTVVLEAEWVLRGVYGFAPDAVAKALRRFSGLPRVTLEDAQSVANALDWAERGMDFADALHFAKAANCDAFVTFDERLAKRANALGGLKARTL